MGRLPHRRRVHCPTTRFGVWHGPYPGSGRPALTATACTARTGLERAARQPAEDPRRPYARRITGAVTDPQRRQGWVDGPDDRCRAPSTRSAGPLAWSRPGTQSVGARPDIPWSRTVISEVHVRGLRAPSGVPPEHRALPRADVRCSIPATDGVTYGELLPLMSIADDPLLRADASTTGDTRAWVSPSTGALRERAGAEVESSADGRRRSTAGIE